MAWLDPNEMHVASNGMVYVAPVGTALPTTPTASLNSAFVGLGYCTTDGVTLTATPDITEIMSWQSSQATRRQILSRQVQASFTLQQFNEDTVPLAFGGGSVVLASVGVYRYDLPTDDVALDERAMIIDAVDGTTHMRIVLPRGNVMEAVEIKFARDSETQLPITFKALQPADGSTAMKFYSDDALAFVAGS